jgi:hypothetical protein
VTVTQQPQPDRCERCLCDDCGGTLAEHDGKLCRCPDCMLVPDFACTAFLAPRRIDFLADAMSLLLSAHLGPRSLRRCRAAAHAAHHALIDYDTARES